MSERSQLKERDMERACRVAELTGVADVARERLLTAAELGAGADGFDGFVYTAPRLPRDFHDNDFDGMA